MKMWISKYALTAGIQQREGKVCGDNQEYFADNRFTFFAIGKDAHKTCEQALAAAEAMRVKKIASLRQQIAKLEKRDFSGDVA